MMENEIIWKDPFSEMDRVFEDFWMPLINQPKSLLKKFADNGITAINRPHNIYSIKDKDGNVIGNKLEVVTTPFKKSQVSVNVETSKRILSVKCSRAENNSESDSEISAFEHEIHHGISSQSYSFSLNLSEKVDVDGITAENKDGMLTIVMPFVKEKEKENTVKTIQII